MTAPGLMSQSEFSQQVEDALGEIADALNDIIDKAERRIRSALDKGWLLGLAGMWAADELWDRFVDATYDLCGKWDEVAAQIRDAVAEVLGDPLAMAQLGSTYQTARAGVEEHRDALSNATATIGLSWSGDAFDAYSQIAAKQETALLAVATALDSASTEMANAAQALVQVWVDQVDNVVQTGLNLAQSASTLADAGNAVTFEIGPIVSLLVAAAEGVKNAIKIWVDYAVTMISTSAQWTSITNGIRTWPVPTGTLDQVSRDPGQWAKD